MIENTDHVSYNTNHEENERLESANNLKIIRSKKNSLEKINNIFTKMTLDSINRTESKEKKEEKKKKYDIFILSFTKKKINFWNNLFLILCMIFFSNSIFMQFEIEKRYKIKKRLKTTFGFNELKNKDYLFNSNISSYFLQIQKNLTQNLINNNYWLLDNKYQLVSNYRITQRKMKLIDRKYPFNPIINNKLNELKWSSNTINANSKFDKNKENNTNFSNDFIFDEENSYLKLGGFVLNYTINNTSDELEKFLNFFINSNTAAVIGDFTVYNYEINCFCSIVIIYQIYDIGFSTINLKIYINNRDLYKNKWSKTRLIFEICFIISYIFYVIVYFRKIHFIVKAKLKIIKLKQKRKFNIEEDKKNIMRKESSLVYDPNLNEFHQKIENKKKIKKKKKKFNILFIQKISILYKIYFNNIFFVMQLLTIILQFLAIIFWIIYLLKMKNLYNKLDESIKESTLLSNEIQNKLIKAGKILNIYKDIGILILFFLFFNLIELYSKISLRAKMFLKAIRYAFPDIFSFFSILIIILLGFSTFSWLYYGRRIIEFYTLNLSFQQNFAFCLGIINSDIFYRMYNEWRGMTICYFIILIVIIRFIIIKIILAILIRNYGIANNEYLQIISFKDLDNKSLNEIKQRPITKIIYWYNRIVNNFINLIICKKNEEIKNNNENENNDNYNLIYYYDNYDSKFKCEFSRSLIKFYLCPEIKINILRKKKIRKKAIEKKHLISPSIITLDEIRNFNKEEKKNNYLKKVTQLKNFNKYDLEYHEDYELIKRNAVFDSEKDQEKIKYYYENKYKRYFLKALFYLCFIIVFIVIYLLNILAPWKFNILHAIGTAFNSTNEILFTKYNFDPIKNKTILPWNISLPLNQINSIQNVRDFIFEEIPSLFEKNLTPDNDLRFSFLKYNYLIGNKILVTLRREKKSKTEKDINKNVSIREEENYYINLILYENKDYFVISDNGNVYFQWNKYKTYKRYGGYNFELDITKNYSDKFKNELINEYTNMIIIEFFLQNFEYELIQHISVIITFDYGDYFKTFFNAQLLKYNTLLKPLDVIKLVFEIIFIFLFIGVIFFFIKIIKEDNILYNRWYRDVIKPLNIKIKDIRYRIEPEFIRKFQAIFGIQQFFEIIIIGLSIAVIYAIIKFKNKEIDLKKIITNKQFDKIYEIRDILYKGESMMKIIETCGIFIILLSCIKILSLINLGKFFTIVIKTFENSKGHFFIFIIIIILIHLPFIFYSTLAFGENDNNFYQIENSIKSCLFAFFGYIDYQQLYQNDETYGPIFFFIYSIIINLIILNLFISILYKSYIFVKNEILGRNEIWNPLYVFCICRKRKLSLTPLSSIKNEFEITKQEKKFKSNILIYQKNFKYEDFISNEKEQYNLINDKIIKIKKKRKDALLAYDSKKIGKEFIFEENIYKNIEKKHLNAFTINHYFNMLNISEELDNDIIQIDDAIQHLKKHEKYMNYEKLIKDIKEKNIEIRKQINDLDSNFIKVYHDLKEINDNLIESNDDVFQTLNTMKSKIENESNYNNNPSNENENENEEIEDDDKSNDTYNNLESNE